MQQPEPSLATKYHAKINFQALAATAGIAGLAAQVPVGAPVAHAS